MYNRFYSAGLRLAKATAPSQLNQLRVVALAKLQASELTSSFHTSIPAMKKIIETVPALGESITEGSIATWSKNPGDKVAVDDVIVIVETDKVTVDIKAVFNGVLTKQLAVDKVNVGEPLYEIDVSDDASASTAVKNEAPVESKKEAVPATKPASNGRVPLIKFIGKRSQTATPQPAVVTKKAEPAVVSQPSHPNFKPSGKAVDYWTLKDGAFFGRPKLEAKEIAAIESGGAF